MIKTTKGFIPLIILIIILLLIVVGGVYIYRNQENNTFTDTVATTIYKNTNIGYQFELPKSWKTLEQGSSLFIFPSIENDKSIDDLYRSNNQGMTLMAITPESKNKLDEFYTKFYKGYTNESFSPKSPDIIDIKSASIPPESDVDYPTYGFIGITYAIKTNKRIYSINSFYKNASDATNQKSYVSRIIETLSEL